MSEIFINIEIVTCIMDVQSADILVEAIHDYVNSLFIILGCR